MAHPEASHRVRVGVLLAGQPGDIGEWLADGAAFDAAGADALWLDWPAEPRLDPLALTAALAAVTFRSLLVTSLPGSDEAAPTRSRTLATIDELSHGRLRIVAETAADAVLGESGRAPRVLRRIAEDAPGPVPTQRDGDEHWVEAPIPDGRATWGAALLDAAQRHVHGLIVPADPRLLDILRNPDDLGDRRDLQLAIG